MPISLPSPTLGGAGAAAQIPMSAGVGVAPVQTPTAIDPAANELKGQRVQAGAMDLQQQQQGQADQDAIQRYLKDGGDLSTPDGLGEATRALKGKVAPDTYTNLVKTQQLLTKAFKEQEQDLARQPAEQLAQHRQTMEEVLNHLQGASDAYDGAIKEGKPDEAASRFQAVKAASMDQLREMRKTNGKPLFAEEDLKRYDEMTPDQLRSAIKTTTFHAKIAENAAKIAKTENEAKLAQAKTEATQAGGAIGILYQNMVDQYGEDSPQAKGVLAKMQGAGGAAGSGSDWNDKEKRLAVGQWIQNPSSLRGQAKDLQQNVIRWAAAMDITPEDVASGQAQRKFDLSAATASGHRAGAMASVEATMPGLIAEAADASSKVPRTSFVPLNKLLQMGEGSISDPALRRFKVANQSVASEFQQVISRGGSNVTSLTEAMHLLQTADSPEAYSAALQQLQREVAINVQGADKVRGNIGGKTAEKLNPKEPAAAVEPWETTNSKSTQAGLDSITDPAERAAAQASFDKARGISTPQPAAQGAAPIKTRSDMMAAIKAGKLKKGDKFIGPDGKEHVLTNIPQE